MEKKRLKLLEVVTVPTENSGIPNVAFNLMRAMPPQEVELGYVAINEPSEYHKKQLSGFGVALHVIPRKMSSPWNYVLALAKIAKGYDVMHVHGNSATMVLEMIAARMAGVPVRAAHSHNTACRMKSIDRLMRPLFHSLCNLRLACGREAGEWLFGERHFEVICNGVETSRFRFDPAKRAEIRQRLGVGDGLLLGNIANFVEAKNHSFLIEIFRHLAMRRPDAKLILLGDGELRSQAEASVKAAGLKDKVIFTGSVDNPADYMSAMDYIVMPSLHEGLPLTLIEEQANGLSALVSASVTREADQTGNLTFMSLDAPPEKWAAALQTLSTASARTTETSDDRIRIICRNGYDISSSASALLELFQSELTSR